MRICLYSHVFLPVVGGIQSVSDTLARVFTQLGVEITLVTSTPADPEFDKQFPYKVLRQPTKAHWKQLLADHDVILSNGFSLSPLKHTLGCGKPLVWVHQMYINPVPIPDWKWWLRAKTRRLIASLGHHIYISETIRQHVGRTDGAIIYNPIDPIFRVLPDTKIENDFAFFGRMWVAKGMDEVIDALEICKSKGHRFTVDFYGEGEDLQATIDRAASKGVSDQVRFLPFQRGEQLVRAMNAAGAVLVPSRWPEPMGIVAIEALACGKCVIGTTGGGLGEVLKGFGPLFQNHNAPELAEIMIRLAEHPEEKLSYEQNGPAHAREFTQESIGKKYLQQLTAILGK